MPTRCPEKRLVGDVPIVSGEVGTGPYGLCHTVPAAMAGRQGVIVYGHGVFTMGRQDFNEPWPTSSLWSACAARSISVARRVNPFPGESLT